MTISTYEDAYFSRESVVNIDAAVVGISKTTWECAKDDANEAKAKMRQYRFDILPIVNGTEVKQYFHTHKWNDFSSISIETITHKDVIPFDTHVRDVIKGFALEERSFYFLHNERRIVGLISVVNLNCRQVKVYLFSLLAELELRLGAFIMSCDISQEELLKLTFGEKVKGKHVDVKKGYEDDKAKGLDVPFVEYLYLSDFINVVKQQKLYERLGYTGNKFRHVFGSSNDLRDKVAHPTRSIITGNYPVKKLWEKIDLIEEALFILKSLQID